MVEDWMTPGTLSRTLSDIRQTQLLEAQKDEDFRGWFKQHDKHVEENMEKLTDIMHELLEFKKAEISERQRGDKMQQFSNRLTIWLLTIVVIMAFTMAGINAQTAARNAAAIQKIGAEMGARP